MKIVLRLILCVLPMIGHANWMILSGKYNGDWRVEVATELKSQIKKLVFIYDFFEPGNYSNVFNSQQVSFLSKYFKGSPYHESVIPFSDNVLKRLLIYFREGSFFINRSYRVKTLLDLDEFFLVSNFPPQVDSTISSLYLDTSRFPLILKKKVLDLLEGKKSIQDVILGLHNWMRNSFFLSLGSDDPILEESSLRALNYEEYLETWMYALRSAGIPARIVHGYSLPASFWLEKGGEKLLYLYPRGEYHWLEFFAGGTGWLPLDPFAGTFFFVPQNLIRKTNSSRFQKNQDRLFIYPVRPADFSFSANIFSEKEMEEKNLKIESQVDAEDYLLTPAVQLSERPIHSPAFVMKFLPKLLGLSDNPLRLDVEVTQEESLSQKVILSKPRKSSAVVLPIYFLELNRKGQVWVEVRSGDKVYKSNVIESVLEKVDLNYRLFQFNFPEEMDLKGEVVLTLKIKNLSAVFWYGIVGNPVGDKQDTFRRKGIYLHADMCYQIK